MATRHRIVGPYYPVGEVDWRCTCGALAELRDPAKRGGQVFRRTDFYCPAAQPEPEDRLRGTDAVFALCMGYSGVAAPRWELVEDLSTLRVKDYLRVEMPAWHNIWSVPPSAYEGQVSVVDSFLYQKVTLCLIGHHPLNLGEGYRPAKVYREVTEP